MLNASLPQLVVFGLDYTLWAFITRTAASPFRKNPQNNVVFDNSGNELVHYEEVPHILETLTKEGIKLAVASKCSSPSKAVDLLEIFGFDKYISYREIHSGKDKLIHIERIHEKSGIPYTEMLFFYDDQEVLRFAYKIHGVAGYEVPLDGLSLSTIDAGIKKFMKLKKEKLVTTSTTTEKPDHIPWYRYRSSSFLPNVSLPHLVVFSLNSTLWPFFQDLHLSFNIGHSFTKNARDNRVFNEYGAEIICCKYIPQILELLTTNGVKVGIAGVLPLGRRSPISELLLAFGFDKYISYQELQSGSHKVPHLRIINEISGIPYTKTLFLDNTSGDSNPQHQPDKMLGVIRYEIPRNGLTMGTIRAGIRVFAKLKKKSKI